MNEIRPCLWFNGNAEAAVKFYQSIFKKTKIYQVHKQDGKVLVIQFRLNNQDLMALNAGPEFKFTPAISFTVSCRTQREVDYYWTKLAKGGKTSCCGWLTDKFGLSWQIVPDALGELMGSKDKKAADRTFEAMMKMTKLDIAGLKRAYHRKES